MSASLMEEDRERIQENETNLPCRSTTVFSVNFDHLKTLELALCAHFIRSASATFTATLGARTKECLTSVFKQGGREYQVVAASLDWVQRAHGGASDVSPLAE